MSDHLRLIVLARRVYEPSRDNIHKRVEYVCVWRPDTLSAHFQWGEQLQQSSLVSANFKLEGGIKWFWPLRSCILPVEGLANLNPKMGIANNIISNLFPSPPDVRGMQSLAQKGS